MNNNNSSSSTKNLSSVFGPIHPIGVTAENLCVSIDASSFILDRVALHVPAGNLMAIMGGSGSGKTTLLNCLAGRSVVSVSAGRVLFNGEHPKKYLTSGMVAYVQQQDNLLPCISVRETLRYAARLRLPKSMSLVEKYESVERVILELGLKECADTLIGDEWRKGISGGEKRRVSVGVQLLLNPSLIFLDEPTTGLDAFSARSLVETLVNLAHNSNRTIILSIHQPRSDIFSCFDQIALLTRGGRLAYCGSPRGSVRFLESIGFPMIGDMNGADFIIDTVAVDDRTQDAEIETRANIDKIVNAWTDRIKTHGLGFRVSSQSLNKDTNQRSFEPVEFNSRVQGAGFAEQVTVLVQRMYVNMWEDRLTLWGSVFEVFFMAVIIGAMFFKPSQDPGGMYDRKSALYVCTAMQNYLGLMFMIYKLSQEMKVFDRERSDKMYSVPAYLISWIGVNFTIYGVLSIIFSAITYYMVDLRTDNVGYHFGMFALSSLMQQWITMAFAYACISFARDFATASLIGNSFFTFLSLSSGFFIPETSIPVYIRWFEYISFVTYGLRLYISNEFHNHVYDCPSIPATDVYNRQACDGDNLITATGFDASVQTPIIGLVTLLLGKLLIACVVLHFFPAKLTRQAATVKSKQDKQVSPSPNEVPVSETAISMETSMKPPNIALEIKKLSLEFEVQSSLLSGAPAKQEHKIILKNVSAVFPPGQLTAILGASGAGKSTLLHLLHGRSTDLPSYITPRTSGSILHNGIEFRKESIDACTASVRQDDTHLLPALTARETLQYAALLRLPNSWTRQRKIDRAEEVLFELGLKDCGDTVVGGEGVKGLSGGEKRRLSVGLAMLMDPAILLLDEPTSGLDSSSARSMMITLKTIASQGRTVVCTIHQPRSDIYPTLDRILLLARGGRVVYEGPGASMVQHFTALGYPLPELTNPADFALDLSSIDLRNADAEKESRDRVNSLIQTWNEKQQATIATAAAGSSKSGGPSMTNLPLFSGEETAAKVKSLFAQKKMSTVQALPLLVARSWTNLRRQPGLIAARICNIAALGVIFTLYFAKITTDQAGITTRIGLLQQTGSIVFIGMLNCIAAYPQELLLFRFEHQDGTTVAESFFLTYTINELPFEIFGAVMFGILAVYAMGLQMNPIWIILVSFINLTTGESIGIAFCTILSKPGFSVQIMSAFISVFNIMQGFLSVGMPQFLKVVNYISILRYTSRTLASKEFTVDRTYTCPVNMPCTFQNGTDVLNFLSFPTGDGDFAWNLAGIFIAAVLYRAIAYFVLKRALP